MRPKGITRRAIDRTPSKNIEIEACGQSHAIINSGVRVRSHASLIRPGLIDYSTAVVPNNNKTQTNKTSQLNSRLLE